MEEIRVHGGLTVRTAFDFCRSVRERVRAGVRTLCLNLEGVKTTDVVGLAALQQSARYAEGMEVRVSILPSPALHRAALDAELLDDLPIDTGISLEPPVAAESDAFDTPGSFLARTRRLGLRQPTWEELALFERWAREPFLDQMVGSELLYRCRHLGPYHPEFMSLVLNDATSLTLLVQPHDVAAPPVGFARLYNIHLVAQFAFLEIAVADLHALRKGWGIEASRLLIAYAMDVLDLRRVEAKVYAYNVLSINSLRRNGFQQEGVLREARPYDGQRWDILVFSLLAGEMLEQRKREQFPYMGFWGGG
ncbi:MAG: GNAT family N-acetyltransferase [Candidatus Rokubacteria bacterium]|nr:GNAT family N-acetyltransferase [Candidatus Rokubacteria bacterium]